MVVFGEWGGNDTDIWVLDLNLNPAQWYKFASSGDVPPGRGGHTAVYDTKAKQMIIFGGVDEQIQGTMSLVSNDTYALKGTISTALNKIENNY